MSEMPQKSADGPPHTPTELMTLQEFAFDFANDMNMAGYVAEVGEEGASVHVGWSDFLGAVDVDMQPPYARYAKKPADLDSIIDRLCKATERKMPKRKPRGWST